MSLRNQPYMKLYVQDFMADEKLMLCSASSTGVYIRLMCLMHKSDQYGVIALNQKFHKSENLIKNFAAQFDCCLPYPREEIQAALEELVETGVLQITQDTLYQKRMVKDGKISLARAAAGSKGGNKRKEKAKANIETESHHKNDSQSIQNEDMRLVTERWNTLQSLGVNPIKYIYPNTKRYENLATILTQCGTESVLKAIDNIRGSDFLTGGGANGWRVTFDWFIQIGNFQRVHDGCYETWQSSKATPDYDNDDDYEDLINQWRQNDECTTQKQNENPQPLPDLR